MRSRFYNPFSLLFICLSIINASAQIENLGKNVNSEAIEINPKISADGKLLFFTRKSKENGIEVEDIWVSELGNGQTWQPAKALQEPFNTGYTNSVSYVSADGNFIIIKGYFEKGEISPYKRGFSVLQKLKSGWSMPEPLLIAEYDRFDKGVHNGLTLSPGGQHLILSLSETKQSINNDLYISFKQKGGLWSAPTKLPDLINLPSNEFSPFVAADGITMYFASDRPGGLGQTDIWVTKRLDDTWLNWSEPQNMGAPINSSEKEGYYSLDASSEYAYMVSAKNSLGQADIVRLKLKKEQKADPVVLVYGKVLDFKTQTPVASQIKYELLPSGAKVGEVNSDPSNGQYKIILPYGKKYEFLAHAPGYLSETNSLDLSKIEEYREVNFDLFLFPIEVGEIVKLNNIFFDYKSSELDPESYPELNNVVDELVENATMVIEIGGHTDNVGSHEYNVALSELRAQSVRKYIVDKGIQPDRVTAKGYGEVAPVDDNATEKGRKANRRVEFKILKK